MKKYLSLLISFIIIFDFTITHYCAKASEAILNDISFELQEDVIDNHFCNIKILDKEYKSYAIECFDVSDNGNVAVGLSDDIVNIYDTNNNFVCGYEINSKGIYALRWENENLYIYFLRYNTAILLSMQGNILNTYTIKVNDNYNDIFDNIIRRKTLKKNGFVYELKYDFFFNINGANKLLKYNQDSQNIILDTSALMKKKLMVTVCIFPVALISVTLIILLLHKSKYKNLLLKH